MKVKVRFCLECFNWYVMEGMPQKFVEEDIIFEDYTCQICGKYRPCVKKVKRSAVHKAQDRGPYKWYEFWKGWRVFHLE